MTLLLFSFRQTSLLTVHTDLHGHTASRCICRSRPLPWCLMYLSRLSGCPKSSQRDAPSSGISLFGTKVISRCFAYDPTNKRQSVAWVGEISPRPQKTANSEVSCEDHVGYFLRLARRNPQRICFGE
jgi:hypothetical protein